MDNTNNLYIFLGVAAIIFSIIQIKFKNKIFKEEYFERLTKRFGKIDKDKTIQFEAITTTLMGVVFIIGGLLNLSVNGLIIGVAILAILYSLFRKSYITLK